MISSSPSTDALWLDTLNRVCGRAGHELRGVLNGVSVNLEVVRSRAAKPESTGAAVAPFAEAAATQFDAVIDMTEGLIGLVRAPGGALEIGRVVRQFAALLEPVARVDERELVVDGSVDSFGAVAVDANAVRLAIGASLLAALDAAPRVTCRTAGHTIEIDIAGGDVRLPGDEVLAAAREAGIEIRAERSAISITFPR